MIYLTMKSWGKPCKIVQAKYKMEVLSLENQKNRWGHIQIIDTRAFHINPEFEHYSNDICIQVWYHPTMRNRLTIVSTVPCSMLLFYIVTSISIHFFHYSAVSGDADYSYIHNIEMFTVENSSFLFTFHCFRYFVPVYGS